MSGIPSKVAVMAVHGVAYHAPGASADAVSELLQGLPGEGDTKPYGPLAAETVHIPLQPLVIEKEKRLEPKEGGLLGKLFGFLQERTVFLTRAWESAGRSKGSSTTVVADDFMRLVLQDYRGTTPGNPKDQSDATSYDTTRLVGTRIPPAGSSASSGKPVDVHVYEMYWADLSRPKSSILAFFQALYQLLFHLASLSRLATSTGLLENSHRWVWRALDRSQHWAVRMLTLPIPALNVLLFSGLLGALPHLFYPDKVPWASAIAAAVLVLCAYGFLSRWLSPAKKPWAWAALPFFLAVLAAGLAFWASSPERGPKLLSFEGLLLGSLILLSLTVDSYDEVRDGAKEIAWFLWAVWLVVFVCFWFCQPTAPVEQVSLWVVQLTLAGLRISWVLVFVLAVVAAVLGRFAWRGVKESNARARAKAAVRTSRFALAMPALGILLITLLLWCGLFLKIAGDTKRTTFPVSSTERTWAERLFGDEIPGTLDTQGHWNYFILNADGAATQLDPSSESVGATGGAPKMSPNDYFKAGLIWTATPGFPVVLLLVLCAFLLMAFWALPSVFSESNPPRMSSDRESERMGKWLSRGLDATAIVSWLFWCAIFLAPVIFSLAWRTRPSPSIPYIGPALVWMARETGTLITWWAVLGGTVAFLTAMAKRGSSVLGIILDVDNYLRTSPKDATPRARILERHVSLLRYLCAYQDSKDGQGYDRVVIVAHSLGSLISADLLRFLTVQGDPGLGRMKLAASGGAAEPEIELRFFTMGNPLRQLLNRFFPYLYEWIRSEPDNGIKALGNPQDSPEIKGEPGPAVLPVKRWLNAYRSGDYVGRSIWLNEWYRPTARPAKDDPTAPVREEMCIGAGAHQHYWDQSAPKIAEKLDELITS